MILRCSILLVVLANIHVKAEISIDSDGGYKNILIGIPPNLDKYVLESMLLQLKTLFRQTSEKLFTASENNVFFKDIVFLLPKEYETSISKTHFQMNGSDAEFFRKPDLYLTEDDAFRTPYTQQHRGCGYPGLRINIPRDYLTSKKDKKALALVREWAHYRYGVFSESGFPDDEVYPECHRVPGSNDVIINACTNDNAIYNERDAKDGAANTCNRIPALGKNEQIVSSIMTNIDFPEMKYFCNSDSRPHNRDSPTKQNALCREKSTWEVISANQDFKIKSKTTSNVMPSFKSFVEPYPDFVVAVDTSSEMGLNDRIAMTHNAFSYFMFYDLAHHSTVRLMDMRSKDNTILEKTILNESDTKWLVGLFPETGGEGDSCVHCTIQKLLEDMKVNVNDVIIITATDMTSSWIDNITAMLKSNKVALHVLYYEKKLRHPAFLERVAKNSGGSFFYIPESFPPGYPISSITVLYEAFRSIYESFSWMNRQRVLVDQMTFTNNCSPCTLSFPTDRTIQTLQVVLTGIDGRNPAVLRDSITLENGMQQFVSRNDSFTYKSEVPAYVITVQNPQEGKWNFSFQRKPGKPVVVIVRASGRNYGDILNMQSWVSSNNKNIDHSDRPPITIFSEIRKLHRPVINNEVKAWIHQASYNTEWSLDMKDGGGGDPDITKNDGIYTRYLTDAAEPGYYSITIVAEKKSSKSYSNPVTEKTRESSCCGSFIPEHVSYESGPFRRVVSCPSFFVGEEKAGITYPPRRITDLRIDRIEILTNSVKCYVLKWTAPGDNYDKGKALSYDIRVFKTREAALNDFHNSYAQIIKMLNIQGPLLEPREAGTVQTAYVELTNVTSGTYFVALKTTNHMVKVSDVSNVVRLTYTEDNPLMTGTGSTNGKYHTSPTYGTTENTLDGDSRQSVNFGLAIGLTCGILFLLLVVGVFLLVYFKNKKSKEKPSATICQNTKKTESSDALFRANGDRNISIISPVTSWDANSLVSRYETLQQRKTTSDNGMLTIPESRETDNISLPSSKYSYDNKMERNSSIYDPIYYHPVEEEDRLNYPYNPTYTPFDPMYTSSMRKLDDSNLISNPYCSDNISYCSYSLPRNQSSRLKTDV